MSKEAPGEWSRSMLDGYINAALLRASPPAAFPYRHHLTSIAHPLLLCSHRHRPGHHVLVRWCLAEWWVLGAGLRAAVKAGAGAPPPASRAVQPPDALPLCTLASMHAQIALRSLPTTRCVLQRTV